MDKDKLYKYLDSSDGIPNKKKELRQFLLTQAETFQQNPSEGERLASEIANLLSTKLAFDLEDEDPYMEVMDLAEQLEVPIHQRQDGASWTNLIDLINKLPE